MRRLADQLPPLTAVLRDALASYHVRCRAEGGWVDKGIHVQGEGEGGGMQEE